MNNFNEVIDSVISRVLQDWAMMLVDRAAATTEIFEADANFYLGLMNFRGVVNGGYGILCQERFLNNLAGNLLGVLEEASVNDKLDALREMANVMSGNLLTEMYGPDTTFDLVLPTVFPADAVAMDEFFRDKARVYCYLGDDAPVAISFWLGGL